MPKVSVIILVYNVEPYIERCLNTLFGQTLDDIEYVFVDDGSTDRSLEIICDILGQYPHRAAQVKILRHECNKGVAAARTTGISAAEGEYMIHCDSDDYTDRSMYERMYESARMTGADIVACDHFCEYEDGHSRIKRMSFGNSPVECLRMWYATDSDYSSLCDKLVRRDIFVSHNIMPYAGIDSGEDFGCMVRVFYHAQSLTYVPEALYHYCCRPDSITRRMVSREDFEQRLRLTREVCGFFEEKGFDLFCNNLKFNTKIAGLHFFTGKEQEWYDLFSECHGYILCYRGESLKSRLLWWSALRSASTFKLLRRFISVLR